MRPRKKINLEPRLALCVDLQLENPEKGDIQKAYPNPNAPLHLEIGCGKGGFICETARCNPQINFLAIEREVNVIISALELAKQMELPNLRFINGDADLLLWKLFNSEEISCIYINFCDPWPKTRHAKRRLTHHTRLKCYRDLLILGGELRFKTDNLPLYDFSLIEFAEVFPPYYTTTDLHAGEYADENIMTEYERRFSELGQPIYSIRARK